MSRSISIEELLGEAAWLRRLAVELVADSARADDLVQETWIAALRRPPAADVAPRRWLARVARNLATNMRRAEARRADHEAQPPPESLDSSPAALAQAVETQRMLAEAVARLDEPLRAVIVLRYFKELDSAAIGRELGLSPSAVRTRLQKAIEELRAELDRKFEGGRAAWSAMLGPFVRGAPVAVVGSTLLLVASVVSVALLSVAGVAAWRLVSKRPEPKEEAGSVPVASADVVKGAEPRTALVQAAREPVANEPARGAVAGAPGSAVEYAELSGRVLVDGRPPEWPVALSLDPDEATNRRFPVGKQAEGIFSLKLTPESQGVFSCKLPAPWSGRLNVSHYTFDNGESSIALPSPVSGLILSLHSGPVILGRFVDRAGAPLAGLEGGYEITQDSRVGVTPGAGVVSRGTFGFSGYSKVDDNGRSGKEGGFFKSRADGRFRVDIQGWGSSATATILVEANDRGYLRFETPTFDPSAGYDAGDLVPEPVRALEFQLHDRDGRPIAAALAHMDPQWSQWSDPTDENGRGVLRFAPARTVAIRVGALRFADRVVTVEPDALPEIELEPLSVLEIQLVGSATTLARLGESHHDGLIRIEDAPDEGRQAQQGARLRRGAPRTHPQRPRLQVPWMARSGLVVTAEQSLSAGNDSISKWLQLQEERLPPSETTDIDGKFVARFSPSNDGRYLVVGLRPDVPFSIDVQDEGGRSLAVRNTSVAAHEWARLEIPVGP